jgi:hypothetical protein
MLKYAPIVAVATAVICAGCVELDGVLDVKPDGSAINRTEIRLETKVVRDLDRAAAAAKRKRPTPPAEETQSFAEMCALLADPNDRARGTPPLPGSAIDHRCDNARQVDHLHADRDHCRPGRLLH